MLLTTPFSWFEQYTHKAKWLGGYKGASGEAALSVDGLKQVMEDQFELLEETNVSFWGVGAFCLFLLFVLL